MSTSPREDESANVSHLQVLATTLQAIRKMLGTSCEKNLRREMRLATAARRGVRHATLHRAKTAKMFAPIQAKLWVGFPRKEEGYDSLVRSFALMGRQCVDSAVTVLLHWLPTFSEKFSVHPGSRGAEYGRIEAYNFDSYINGLRAFKARKDKDYLIELYSCVVNLTVADLLATLLSLIQQEDLRLSLRVSLKNLAFQFFVPPSPKKMDKSLWTEVTAVIKMQWKRILAIVSRRDLPLKSVFDEVAKRKKDTDEMIALYDGVSWIKIETDGPGPLAYAQAIFTQLSDMVVSTRSKPLRVQLINTIRQLLHTVNVDALWDTVVAPLFERASSKWSKHSETKRATLHLMTVIIACSPNDFFQRHFTAFLKKLLKGAWEGKPQHLHAILELLRGKFVPPRISWAPAEPARKGPSHLDHSLPYSYVPLAVSGGAMIPHLQSILMGLFQKGGRALPNAAEQVDTLVNIVLQMCAHSLSYCMKQMIPSLFEDSKNAVHQLVAVRCVHTILDASTGFYENAGCTPKPAEWEYQAMVDPVNYSLSRPEIIKSVEALVLSALRDCKRSVGITVMGTSSEPLSTSSYLKENFQLLNEVDGPNTPQLVKIKDSIERWSAVIKFGPERRAQEEVKGRRAKDERVQAALKTWLRDSGIQEGAVSFSPPEAVLDRLANPRESRQRRRRGAAALSGTQQMVLETYKHALSTIPLILTKENLSRILAEYSFVLRHVDEEVATVYSHALQKVVLDSPELRTDMLGVLVHTLESVTWNETPTLQTILDQILLLIDLWTYLLHSNHGDNVRPDEPALVDLEAVLTLYLCHPNTLIRSTVFRIIQALSNLQVTRGLAYVLDACGEEIMQQARYHYVLDLTHGQASSVTLDHKSELPTIEEVVNSNQSNFWCYVLAEVGHSLVDEASDASIGMVRRVVTSKSLKLSDPKFSDNPFYHETWRMYWSLSLALLGVPSHLITKRAQWTSAKGVVDDLIGEYVRNAKLMSYVASDSQVLRDTLILSCGAVHWSSLSTLVKYTMLWSDNVPGGHKKNPHLRPTLASILRNVSEVQSFGQVLRSDEGLTLVYAKFLQDACALFDQPFGRASTFALADQFSDVCMTVKNFSNALFSTPVLTESGPLRGPVPLLSEKLWPVSKRYELFAMLCAWSGLGEVSLPRRQAEQQELERLARSAREPQHELLKQLEETRCAAVEALAAFVRLGSVFPKENVFEQRVFDWVLLAEREGHRILRWILKWDFASSAFRLVCNFIFDETRALAAMNSVSAGRPQTDPRRRDKDQPMLLALHALYDVFVPYEVELPRSGVTSDVTSFVKEYSLMKAKVAELEKTAPTPADVAFEQLVVERSGVLWHLALMYMAHPDARTRRRSFQLLRRLAPWTPRLGKDGRTPAHPEPGSSEAEEAATGMRQLARGLDAFDNPFTYHVLDASKSVALRVSSMMAQHQAGYGETLFREAFHRCEDADTGTKRWILNVLLPWCDRLILDDQSRGGNTTLSNTNLKIYTPHIFLEKMYQQFTLPSMDVLTDELMTMWNRIASAHKGNLSYVVSYLVSKASAFQGNVSVVRTLLLQLYRVDPQGVLTVLVYYLSFAGIRKTVGDQYFDDALVNSESDLSNTMRAASAQTTKLMAESNTGSIPQVSAVILVDLICDNLTPLLPYLHILINYAMLESSISTRHALKPGMSASLNTLLLTVLLVLKQAVEASDEDGEVDFMPVLESIIAALRMDAFAFNWNASKYARVSGAVQHGKDRPQDSSSSMLDPTRAELALQTEMKYNETFKELAPWTVHQITVAEFVRIVCQCFHVIKGKLIRKWGNEAFQWLAGCKDVHRAICALEIYRSILEPVTGETLNALTHRLLDYVRHVEVMRKIRTDADLKSETAENRALYALSQGKASEILMTLQRTILVLSDLRLLSRVFWVAVALLYANHETLEHLAEHSFTILEQLHEAQDFFMRLAREPDVAAECFGMGRDFSGLQPLLFCGLYQHRKETVASKLMVALMPVPLADLVDPTPFRYVLGIMTMLPWLHHNLEFVSRMPADDEDTPHCRAGELAEALQAAEGVDVPETVKALERYAKGKYQGHSEKFLKKVCRELHANWFPEAAPAVGRALMSIADPRTGGGSFKSDYSFSVLCVINVLLRLQGSVDYAYAFSDAVRLASSRSHLLPAQRLLDCMTRLTLRPDEVKFHTNVRPLQGASASKASKPASRQLHALLRATTEAGSGKKKKRGSRVGDGAGKGDAVAAAVNTGIVSGADGGSGDGASAAGTGASRGNPGSGGMGGTGPLVRALVDPGKSTRGGRRMTRRRRTHRRRPSSAKREAAAAAAAEALSPRGGDSDEGEDSSSQSWGEWSDEDTFGEITAASILQHESQRPYLDEFLEEAKGTVNGAGVAFFEAVWAFERQADEVQAGKDARAIMNRFGQPDSPDFVGLSEQERSAILDILESSEDGPPASLFEFAKEDALRFVEETLILDFKMSDQYIRLLSAAITRSGEEDDFDESLSFDTTSSSTESSSGTGESEASSEYDDSVGDDSFDEDDLSDLRLQGGDLDLLAALEDL